MKCSETTTQIAMDLGPPVVLWHVPPFDARAMQTRAVHHSSPPTAGLRRGRWVRAKVQGVNDRIRVL